MNKKIFFLIVQICLFTTKSFGQCPTPLPNCIQDQHVQNGATNWHTSSGTLNFSDSNASTSPASSKSLVMSYYQYGTHMSGRSGDGATACYKFDSGKVYRVCFWARSYTSNMAAVSNVTHIPHARLYVYAGWQFVNQSYINKGYKWEVNMSGYSRWEFITDTFTARGDFTTLRLYPFNYDTYPSGNPLPPGYLWDPFTVLVDDIRVTEEPSPISLAVSDNTGGTPINGCAGQVQMTVSGMPPNAIATWTPSVTLNQPNGSDVTTTPCSTTTYKIEIVDPSSSCGNCIREVLYHTINVNQWSDPARIMYPTSIVPCTTPFNLEYDDPGTCAAMSNSTNYTWIEPDGTTTHTGKLVTISNANAYHTGEWTLRIWNSNKSCPEEHKFNITVGTCCIASPDFIFTGSNPISFSNTGSGITNHVSTLWNFGDGTTSDLTNPIHSYNVATPTPFSVCLTMLYEDGQGENCCNRICKTVIAGANSNACLVTANFNYALVGWSNKFNFNDASSGSGTICNYQWDFGDGTMANTAVPTINHTYTTAGPWWVCLTATNCVYDADGTLIRTCTNKKCMWVYPPEGKPAYPGSGDQIQPTQAKNAISHMNKFEKGGGLMVYPNPNNGDFTLNLYNRSGSYQVVVSDVLGREIYNQEHVFSNTPVKIALSHVSNGIYSIVVRNDNEEFIKKISITK